jgi:hypothetical protein
MGLKYVSDYHQPESRVYGAYLRSFGYIMTEDIDRALGYATSAAVAMAAAVSPEISGVEPGNEEALQAAQANQAAWLEWKSDQAEKYYAWRNSLALFGALECHIETNLLHYLRPIWIAEDPALRLKRHARELGIGEVELRQFVKQPLLGFHLNCCIYPCEPPAYENMVPMMTHRATHLRNQIGTVLRSRAVNRFERDAQLVLDQAIAAATQQVTTCQDKDKQLTIEALPKVLNEAGKKITALRREVTKESGWKRYLSNHDQVLMAQIENRAAALEQTHTQAEGAIDNGLIKHIENAHTTVGERLRELNESRDFKPVMVVLPDGGYYCEPVLGQCSAAELLRQRTIEADTTTKEALARKETMEADRRKARLDAGQLDPEPSSPTLVVKLQSSDSE